MSAQSYVADERAVRRTSAPVMGMVLFVAGEAMFFAAFFGAYFSVRTSAKAWPPHGIETPGLLIPTTLTLILISSSVTLQVGVAAIRRNRVAWFRRLLGLTLVLGLSFLVLQAYDYSRLTFGIKDGIYPSLYYVMTGLHMAHVIGGVVFLFIIMSQLVTRQITPARHESLSAAALYWHFVDIVWICLFIAFYASV